MNNVSVETFNLKRIFDVNDCLCCVYEDRKEKQYVKCFACARIKLFGVHHHTHVSACETYTSPLSTLFTPIRMHAVVGDSALLTTTITTSLNVLYCAVLCRGCHTELFCRSSNFMKTL